MMTAHIGASARVMTLALVVFVAPSADAVDGVIEINQARALAGGVTGGDTAGFPVEISTPGSYRLTGDLSITTATDPGIIITAPNVTLDLNGFAIIGPVSCSGTPADCPEPNDAGDGVASNASNVTVKNGTVRGHGNMGLSLSALSSRVERVRAIGNAADGIRANTVIDCEGTANGLDGIRVLVDGLARGNRANDNGNDGIAAENSALLVGNTTMQNGGDGVDGGSWVLVTQHNAVRNTTFGVKLFNGGLTSVHAFFNNPPNSCVNDQTSGGVDMGNNSCCGAVGCP